MHLWHNDIDGFDELRRRHLVPEPPYGQGRVAADAGATAMTDVSDGLVADLGHIAHASGVGIDVSTEALAADRDAVAAAAAALEVDPWAWVLGGGEDHALVATFPGAPPAGWRVDRHGDRRSAAGAGGRRRVGRKSGLAVVLSGRTLG